jgi:glycine oxidase
VYRCLKIKGKRLLIIGQGLCGSHLALEAIRRGAHVTVVDFGRGLPSSRIAAGLLNPAAGRRFTMNESTWQQWRIALHVYRYWERKWQIPLLQQRRMWRLIRDEQEKHHYEKRREFLPAQVMMSREAQFPHPDQLPEHWKSQEGIQQNPIYLLQIPSFLDQCTHEIETKGTFVRDWFSFSELSLEGELPCWNGEEYDYVFMAEGAMLSGQSPFGWVPLVVSKGKIVRFPTPPLDVSKEWVLNSGYWYFCRDNEALLGSTGDAGVVRSLVDAIMREEHANDSTSQDADIQPLLKTYGLDETKLQDAQQVLVGYRPRTRDNQPLAGFHPRHQRVAILNGTGGRGGILAPFLAMRLFANIEHGMPLPVYADCCRNSL